MKAPDLIVCERCKGRGQTPDSVFARDPAYVTCPICEGEGRVATDRPATLTDAQAAMLRDRRKQMLAAVNTVSDFASLTCDACPHVEDEQPDTCPMCRLYRMFADASNALHGVPEVIDHALLRGPHPAKRACSPSNGSAEPGR